MNEIEKTRVRNQKRRSWAQNAIGSGRWRLKHREPKFFPGSRTCAVCKRTIYNCFELETPHRVVVHVGRECLVTAIAYQDGALDEFSSD